jgi:hypothetical protein
MTIRYSLRLVPGVMSAVLLVLLVGCSSSSTDDVAGTAAPGGTPAPGGSSVAAPHPTGARTPTGSAASSPAPATTQPTGPGDACRLVTSAEARAVLGKPVRAGKSRPLGPHGEGATCTYESTDFADGTANGTALTITLFSHSAMSRSEWDDAWRSNKHKPVAGLGESAWFLGGVLDIYDRGTTIGVGIVSLKTEATLATVEPVARLALGRV